jgi:hypothetical protein
LDRPTLHIQADDMTLFESDSQSTGTPWDDERALTDPTALAAPLVPVLHKTKWVPDGADGNKSRRRPVMELEVSDPAPVTTVHLDFFGVTLRHVVESTWLTSTLNILFASCEGASTTEPVREGPARVTKSFVTVHKGIIDYLPSRRALESRAVLTVGAARFSCNLVSGAAIQAYKFLSRDTAAYLINERIPYVAEDLLLFDGRQDAPAPPPPTSSAEGDGHACSVQQYLEQQGYAQMATLDVMDVLLQSQDQDGSVTNMPNVVLELSTGMLFLYTCADSLAVMQVRHTTGRHILSR